MKATATSIILLAGAILLFRPPIAWAQQRSASNSWSETKKAKQGTVTAYWHESKPFIFTVPELCVKVVPLATSNIVLLFGKTPFFTKPILNIPVGAVKLPLNKCNSAKLAFAVAALTTPPVLSITIEGDSFVVVPE